LITEFINNPDLKLLIGNILSVGTGTDGLQKVCSNVAIVELPWSPAELWQLISRLDRNGQKQPVNAYILAVYNSIDEVLARVLDKKKNILNEVLDGESSGVSDSLLHLLKGVNKI
jgi:SNF2 family DNA or RNA helicase